MKKLLLFTLIMLCVSAFAQKQYTLQSPNGKITVTVSEDEICEMNSEQSEYWLYYSIKHEETAVLDKSAIFMQIDNGKTLGISSKPSIITAKTQSVNQTVKAPFYKRAEIQDQYNELTLSFKGNYKVIFRAYNEGIAYRFQTDFKKPFKVIREFVEFKFDEDYTAWVPYVNARKGDGNFIEQQFYNSFENTYTVTPLSKMEYDRLAFLPLLIELKDGKKAVITEADLEDYPGMYLRNSLPSKVLHAYHAGYPKTREQGGHNNLQWIVKERENYIAKVEGKRSFPWRIITISENDKELADNDLVYLLASPNRIGDVSWIQPGKWLGTGGTPGISMASTSRRASTTTPTNTTSTLPANTASNMSSWTKAGPSTSRPTSSKWYPKSTSRNWWTMARNVTWASSFGWAMPPSTRIWNTSANTMPTWA